LRTSAFHNTIAKREKAIIPCHSFNAPKPIEILQSMGVKQADTLE